MRHKLRGILGQLCWLGPDHGWGAWLLLGSWWKRVRSTYFSSKSTDVLFFGCLELGLVVFVVKCGRTEYCALQN